jgi:hypothetical protein
MIIKNLMPNDYVNNLRELMDTPYFPWYYKDNQVSNKNTDQIFGFTHCFFKDKEINSTGFNTLIPLISEFSTQSKLKVNNIFRLQANLIFNQPVSETTLKNGIHRDIENIEGNFVSFVYYVIDSDGDTVLYNEDMTIKEKASPISNNCIYFNSRDLHEANLPKKNKKRIVINCVLEIENDKTI